MISLIVLLGSILYLQNRRRHGKTYPKKICRMLLVAELAALILSGTELLPAGRLISDLVRPENGEAGREESLIAGTKEGKIYYQLTLEEREMSAREAEDKITAARTELADFLRENTEALSGESPDPKAGEERTKAGGGKEKEETEGLSNRSQGEGDKADIRVIDRDIRFPQSLQKGQVALHWSMQPEGILEQNGRFHRDLLSEDQLIAANLVYICGSSRREETIRFLARAYPADSKEEYRSRIKRALEGREKTDRQNQKVDLPEQDFRGEAIRWMRPYSWRGEKLLALGFTGALLMLFAQKKSRMEAVKRRRENADRDYPSIISEIALYLSAGVTVKNALERISAVYEERRKRGQTGHEGYEALSLLVRCMKEGISERQAYEDWPGLCPTASYRKLSMLLIQNLQRGNRRLAELFEEEKQRAEEAGRLRCKKLGDEASTRLLIPMVGLLAVVLMILLAPALFIHL